MNKDLVYKFIYFLYFFKLSENFAENKCTKYFLGSIDDISENVDIFLV